MRKRITRKLRTSWLGSGPRGRRFKSSRPDQFLRNSRNSVCRCTRFLLRIPVAEPSGLRFKHTSRSKLFEIIDLRRIEVIRPADLGGKALPIHATRHVLRHRRATLPIHQLIGSW